MPLNTLREDLSARYVSRISLTRGIGCPRCDARPQNPCIAQDGERAGTEMEFHHIHRIAIACPDIIPSVPDAIEAVALAHDPPPDYPSHFSEARIALALRIKSVHCPVCDAAPGQPCEGRAAFNGGTMSMYHLPRAVAAEPGLLEAV